MKRAVTQEELDSLYQVLKPFREAIRGTGESIQLALPQDANTPAELVGVHIGSERTNILFLSGLIQHGTEMTRGAAPLRSGPPTHPRRPGFKARFGATNSRSNPS